MKVNFNHIALRKAKTVCSFGLSECNRVNQGFSFIQGVWSFQTETTFYDFMYSSYGSKPFQKGVFSPIEAFFFP